MTCERVREQIPECLAGRLEKAARESLVEHLETCSACRNELAELGIVWRGLEAMSAPEPDRAMRTRFMEMLSAYQAGLEQAPAKRPARGAREESGRNRWFAWWPSNPAWQLAIAAGLLIVGVVAGRYEFGAPREMSPEMAQLKGQVEGLRQLVALSLMQEQSPSDRLRGVSFSSQMVRPDAQVEQALLRAVNHDPNVNVRLSAVDALQTGGYARDPDVRRALADTVMVQDSALVQVAIIDLLVETSDHGSAPGLRNMLGKVAQDGQMDEVVRQRATLAVHKLEVTQ
jgi:HEAT repeats/Putative zinc-finger